uniref:Mechanosensitive ion channel protein n=1 Tax=Anthurium amnicola TaxID=1678845 RepID=A0A1D1Y1A8_9ARAE
MDALRRSFKPPGSYKHPSSRGPSVDLDNQEQQPILSDHRDPSTNSGGDHRPEVVVKVDGNSNAGAGNNSRVWRGSSYEFWKDGGGGASNGCGGSGGGAGFSFSQQAQLQSQQPMVEISEDPPSKLISTFLHKQKASGGDVSLDMDMEMEELRKPPPPPPAPSPGPADSKELRVSFQDPSAAPLPRRRRRSSHNGSSSDSDAGDRSQRVNPRAPSGEHGSGAEVLKCSSNSSFRRASGLLRTKTKSRLMDPPPPPQCSGVLPSGNNDRSPQPSARVPRSGQVKSGILGGKTPQHQQAEEDDDPFADEDVPEEYRRDKLDTLTMLQWVSLFLILAALVCSLTIPVLERQTAWGLHLWKWDLLVLVLICGRLVSGWAIRAVVFFFERNFLLRKRVLYFVYGLRRAVQNCLWLGLLLLAWHYIFDKKVERETNSKTLPYVTKVFICLLVATLLRLVKTLLVKVLASSFHVGTYFDRIQESLFNQYVVETLSGPPSIEIQHIREEEEQVMAEVRKLQDAGAAIPPELKATVLPSKNGRLIGPGSRGASPKTPSVGKSRRFSGAVSAKEFSRQQGEGITVEHLHKLNQKNVSAWNMKRLMNIVRHGYLSTLDEQIPDVSGEDESATQIRSEYEAKAAAKKIFTNVAKPGSKYIYLVDLMRFMREDEALKTMSLFEGAQESKRVTRHSLKNWVVNAFRERRALSLTLNDTKTAVNKLHQMANIVVAIIVFVIWLLILGIATTHFLVFISSQILLVVFIFGNTCKAIFEALIFLFVMHPFDVGDRCEVDGVQMIVEEMNIMTTVFLRYDNQKISYPNSVLSTKPISNYYRSPDMGDAIDFCIHVATSVEKVAIMKERIKAYIEDRKEHWYPNPNVVLRDVEDMNRLKVSVWLRHRMNHQDMGERWTRRELVVQEMIKIFRDLDIEYRMLPLDVNVRNMAPLSSSRLPSNWTVCG